MNFEEWKEKKRKESAVLPGRESDSGEWPGQQRRFGGGSVVGTMGERYEDGLKELEDVDIGSWVNALAKSAAKSLYKEAIGASGEISDDFFAMAELVYKMYGQEAGEDKQSFLNELAKFFLG